MISVGVIAGGLAVVILGGLLPVLAVLGVSWVMAFTYNGPKAMILSEKARLTLALFSWEDTTTDATYLGIAAERKTRGYTTRYVEARGRRWEVVYSRMDKLPFGPVLYSGWVNHGPYRDLSCGEDPHFIGYRLECLLGEAMVYVQEHRCNAES